MNNSETAASDAATQTDRPAAGLGADATDLIPDVVFTPDVGFTLGGLSRSRMSAPPAESPAPAVKPGDVEVVVSFGDPAEALVDIPGYAQNLARAIIDTVLPSAPPDWRRLDMSFSVTVQAIAAAAIFTDDIDDLTAVAVPQQAGDLAQLLREVTVPLADRAWWRVLLHYVRAQTDSADEMVEAVEIEYDYGDVPFADDELLSPAAYRADLEAFPRDRLPVWLAAYIFHDGRQSRPPRQAVVRSRADIEDGIRAVPAGLPLPELMWARWATVAAAAVAIGADTGPRVLGSMGLFEASNGSGSTFHLLSGRRAVLSGGVRDAPELDAAYNGNAELPNYYAGAPEWVANPVLNQRAAAGLLSFCYWWDGTGWYRGESPEPTQIGPAIPGLWTPAVTVDVVLFVLHETASRPAVTELVEAAESRSVTADLVLLAFEPPDDSDVEIDLAGAMYQFAAAGLTG